MARNLRSLMARLNSATRTALEGAVGAAMSQSHYDVELEHWLLKLLESSDLDVPTILRNSDIDVSRVVRDIRREVDTFKTGNSRNPALATALVRVVEQAWMICSIELGDISIRSGHLLCALLLDGSLAARIVEVAPTLRQLGADTVLGGFAKLTAGSLEQTSSMSERAGGDRSNPESVSPGGSGNALDKFTNDLTAQAKAGKIDPIVGRDEEVRQMVDILMRRRQNNPILTGEPGVGKTAVVEGLACQIVAGDVPPPLQKVSIRTLDLGLLQAGAGVKGEFENRLKSVISEVKASPTPIILFIDEAHTLIGAGGSAGQADAANLLKPALARGELRTIAATTWAEYKKYFETDAALTRRFQVVKVEEPSEEKAILMLRGVATRLEHHHKVRITSEAVSDAVHLSSRYLTDRQLPDKAVSVLDTACARVAVSQCAVPAPVEDRRRYLLRLNEEESTLQREQFEGKDHTTRIKELDDQKRQTQAELADLEVRWNEERRLVQELTSLRSQISVLGANPTESAQSEALRQQMSHLDAQLRSLQSELPLVHPLVGSGAVASVIAGWTGVPVGKMLRDELNLLRTLEQTLGSRVVGQQHAMDIIAQTVQIAKAGLRESSKPLGVFLLVGPSGVGKTETAMALADLLYGGESSVITINMSEYQEAHTVANLKGSPRGYVGYGEGGVLTEAIRRRPYSIVLLDEIEKAHREVLDLFYQVFDKGTLQDTGGRDIDFTNTIILLTSNLASDMVMARCRADSNVPNPDELGEMIRPALLRYLRPEMLGRMTVLPYYPLHDEALSAITQMKLERVAKRSATNQQVDVRFDSEVVSAIVARCTEVDSGARNIDHIISRTLLPLLSREVLSGMAEGRKVQRVDLKVDDHGAFRCELV